MVTTQLLTARDLWDLSDTGEDYELIEGALSPMVPPNGEHGSVQAQIAAILVQHARQQQRKVFVESGFILGRNPDTVLAPDVALVETSRLPDDLTGYLELAPDLAVEIVSPGNSPGEIERKIAIYLQAGTRAIWVVYPRQRRVVVHVPGEAPRVFSESDDLPGDDLLPGFAERVGNIFA